jgi:hypothetical protein
MSGGLEVLISIYILEVPLKQKYTNTETPPLLDLAQY